MTNLVNQERKTEKIFYVLPWLLLLPAYSINIHLNPLLADEPIRAVVALEMWISDNIWIPSINGEYYYNKPPLFNWILLSLYHLTGSFEEWVVRIPTVVSLVLYGISIYLIFKKEIGKKAAFVVAFATLTSGRILFYDSFLGLIDSLFSFVVFLNFMSIYFFMRKEKWWQLYLISYFLMAVAFMLKGLPAIVFVGFTFLVVAISERKFKKLFVWQHVLGGLLFLGLVGLYYFFYQKYNSLDQVFTTLWGESTKRTVAESTIGNSIFHILTFPFDFIIDFLPLSAMVVFAFNKRALPLLREHSFLRACVLIFAANIIVYWLSPETRPRYLFMFLPLFFSLPIYLFFEQAEGKTRLAWVFKRILFFLTIILGLAAWAPLFVFPNSMINGVLVAECMGVSFAILTLAFYYHKFPRHQILIFISVLLIVRLGFDFFVLPFRQTRYDQLPDIKYKEYAIKVGKLAGDEPLYVFRAAPLDPLLVFYISRETQQIIRRLGEWPGKGSYLILLGYELNKIGDRKYTIVYEFETKFRETPLYLIRLNCDEENG